MNVGDARNRYPAEVSGGEVRYYHRENYEKDYVFSLK